MRIKTLITTVNQMEKKVEKVKVAILSLTLMLTMMPMDLQMLLQQTGIIMEYQIFLNKMVTIGLFLQIM